jgi:predicted nuclease of predicted toxin-antitoxin system
VKFLADQDVYGVTIRFLRELGHEVIPVADIGLAQGGDEELLKTAQTLGRIFVTRDRDFGNLVFVKALGAGVIYLRIAPSTQQSAHDQLEKVLKAYSTTELMNAFVVVEPDGYRFRKLPH